MQFSSILANSSEEKREKVSFAGMNVTLIRFTSIIPETTPWFKITAIVFFALFLCLKYPPGSRPVSK